MNSHVGKDTGTVAIIRVYFARPSSPRDDPFHAGLWPLDAIGSLPNEDGRERKSHNNPQTEGPLGKLESPFARLFMSGS